MWRGKIILLLLSQLTFLSCGQTREKAKDNPVITAKLIDEKIQIDGQLAESAWHTAQEILLRENDSGAVVSNVSLQTRVKTCYDADRLYIAFACNDADVWGTFADRDDHLWLQEAVEVFIDCDTVRNTYVEIEVSPRNVQFDSYIIDPVNIDIPATKAFDLKGFESAVSVDGTLNNFNDRDVGWTIEMAIPFESLLSEPARMLPGETSFRINFYRIERARNNESTHYAWSPTAGRFHKPSAFGILKFAKE